MYKTERNLDSPAVVLRPSQIQDFTVKKERVVISKEDLKKALNLTTEYSEDYSFDLVLHCRKGESIESFCGKKLISPSQLDKWSEEHVEMREARKLGIALQIAYWEKKLEEELRPQGLIEDDEVKANAEMIKFCKFKLENLGYKSKINEGNNAIFEPLAKTSEDRQSKKRQLQSTLASGRDVAKETQDKLERYAKVVGKN